MYKVKVIPEDIYHQIEKNPFVFYEYVQEEYDNDVYDYWLARNDFIKDKCSGDAFDYTDIEVALTDLGKIATRELAKEHKPYGLEQNKKIAKMGGSAAKAARDNIEKNLGKTVISNKNSLNYEYIDEKLLEEKN